MVFTLDQISGDIEFMVYDNEKTLKENKIIIYGLTNKDRKDNTHQNNEELLIFDDRLSLLAKSIFKFLLNDDSDNDDDGAMIFLSEVDKMKDILEGELKHQLKMDQYKEYLDNLYFLEGELNRHMAIKNYDEIQGRGSR